jgi:hypothetical protein
VQAGRHEHRRVILARDLVIGRVEHVVVLLLFSCLVELVGRERDALVGHGRDDVHERHLRDDRAVVAGAMFATAPINNPPALPPSPRRARVRVALLHQEARDVDEVRERVDLVEEAALVVPAPAHLLTATDVRDRIDETTVEQRESREREIRVHRIAIGTVAVLQHRRRAVVLEAVAVDERHRHLRAVRAPRELRAVVRGIEVTKHRRRFMSWRSPVWMS